MNARARIAIVALFLIGAVCVSAAFAHHGTGISYDQDSLITLHGTVTEFVLGLDAEHVQAGR
jgi:hypothetical protein